MPQTLHVDYMVRASHYHTRVSTNYTGLESLLQSCKSRVHLHTINLSRGVSFNISPVFIERPISPNPLMEAEEVRAEETYVFSESATRVCEMVDDSQIGQGTGNRRYQSP